MFAWILKTKPLKTSSSGRTSRVSVAYGCGGGAHSTKASISSSTPKLFNAVPKNTGVRAPDR